MTERWPDERALGSLHAYKASLLQKKPVPCTGSQRSAEDGARAAARSRLAAVKNAMRERLRQGTKGAEAGAADCIVFDAGFFRVESPAKSFSGQ